MIVLCGATLMVVGDVHCIHLMCVKRRECHLPRSSQEKSGAAANATAQVKHNLLRRVPHGTQCQPLVALPAPDNRRGMEKPERTAPGQLLAKRLEPSPEIQTRSQHVWSGQSVAVASTSSTASAPSFGNCRGRSPAFARMRLSISSAIAECSRKYSLAASRPCPISSSSYR